MKWPKRDRECRAVIPNQVKDLERALKHVKEHVVCVQAGGNVGYWPKYLSTRFETVYTFEPDAENYDCLQQNVTEPNIVTQCAALGDEYSRGGLDGDPINCGSYQVCDGDDFDVITIDSLKLDALDFLCLDIEGMELKAIEGGIETIKTYSPVIMVEDKGHSERYGSKVGDIASFLEDYGYEVIDKIHRDIILARP